MSTDTLPPPNLTAAELGELLSRTLASERELKAEIQATTDELALMKTDAQVLRYRATLAEGERDAAQSEISHNKAILRRVLGARSEVGEGVGEAASRVVKERDEALAHIRTADELRENVFRGLLGARDGEAASVAAERVVKERNAEAEHARKVDARLVNRDTALRLALGAQEGETVHAAVERVVRERNAAVKNAESKQAACAGQSTWTYAEKEPIEVDVAFTRYLFRLPAEGPISLLSLGKPLASIDGTEREAIAALIAELHDLRTKDQIRAATEALISETENLRRKVHAGRRAVTG